MSCSLAKRGLHEALAMPTNYSNSSWYSYDDLGNRISHKYRTASAIGYEYDP